MSETNQTADTRRRAAIGAIDLAEADASADMAPVQLAMHCTSSRPWSELGGQTGPAAPPRTEAVATGTAGTAGKIDIKAQATLADFMPVITSSHINMMLNASVRDYVNQQFDNALQRLIWLKALVGTYLKLPAAQRSSPDDSARIAAYTGTIDTLIRQLNMGLDYYAKPLNAVPLVSVDYYRSLLNDLFAYGRNIEASYLAYSALQRDASKAREAFLAAKTKAQISIQGMQADAQQLLDQQQPLTDTIVRLGATLDQLWLELMGSEEAFKSAVANRGQGCDFTQVLTICASVATLVATGGTAAAAIGVALSAVENKPLKYDDGKPVGDDFKGFQFKVNTIVKAGKTAASFADAFGKVKNTLSHTASDVSPLPSDEAKIVASADDIQAQLKPFLDMPEAQRYQALIRSFASTSQARNNKILEYNNLLLQWEATDSRITQTQLDADAAQTAFAAEQNPFVGEAQSFMAKAWITSKGDIVRALHDVYRAYRYYSLTTTELTINDFAIAALEASQENILSLYVQQRAAYGAAPANITNMKIDLLPHISLGALKRFRDTGKVTVAIPEDQVDLLPYSNVLATRVGLEMLDASGPPKRLQANITHEGRALIFDQSRRSHTFSHVAVPIPFEINNGSTVVDGTIVATSGRGSMSSDSAYAGLSPYGPWTIEISLDTLESGFMGRMKQLSLVFDGKGRGHS